MSTFTRLRFVPAFTATATAAAAILLAPPGMAQVVPPPPFGAINAELTRVYTGEILTTFSLLSLRNVNPVVRTRMVNARLEANTKQKVAQWDAPDAPPLMFASTTKDISLPSVQDTQAASPWGVFATLAHDKSEREGAVSANPLTMPTAIGFDGKYSTLTAGGDYRLNDAWLIGAAVSLGRANAKLGAISNTVITASAGQIDANIAEVSAYATWSNAGWYVDALATVASLRFDTARNVLTGNEVRIARGAPSGRQVSAGLTAGYDWRSGIHTISPYLRAEGLKLNIDGYQESGSAGYDAGVGKQARDSLQSVLGVRYSQSLSLDAGVVVPQLTVELIREMRKNKQALVATPVSSTIASFPVSPVDQLDRSFVAITLGATGQFANNWSGFAQVEHYLAYTGIKKTVAKIGVQKEL